ncbi:uncharacterized protein LOC134692319 [Mytilus trossulus]|uniref:uncharacterized protein LOC134692319 n=1 Tax=Mytilus trossulus TaxID=6551 RepID=UPI0030069AC0
MTTCMDECDIFTCPICLEKLKSPTTLPCSHNFCETCIGEFILSTERQTGHKLSSYPCPVCRSVVTTTKREHDATQCASLAPHSLTISAKMDQSESTKQECHLCKKQTIQNVASYWCRECSEAFCDECLRLHNLMKISADHKVVHIEKINNCTRGGEPDFSLISDKCSIHNSKILEAFCFDHQELCCLLCLTAHHRKCENIQAIEELTNLNTDGIEFFKYELNEVKAKVKELIEEKTSNYEKLDNSFQAIELAAKASAASIKDSVDILLASFLKELDMSRDAQNTVFEAKSKTTENLLSRVVSLMKTTDSVRDNGTLNQMFIHLKKSKPQLRSKLVETSKILNVKTAVEARFAVNKIFHQVEKAVSFGQTEVICSVPIDLNEFVNFNPLDTGTITNIKLRHKKTLSFEFDVNTVCMMNSTILVGGEYGVLNAVDCVTSTCVAKTTFNEGIKRLTCDIENLTIYVSCYDAYIYSCKIKQNRFVLRQEIKNSNREALTGGLCIFNGFMYIIVRKSLQMINIDNKEIGLQKCFYTDTNCNNKFTGLATDIKNKRFLYTSDTDQVVATTIDGTKIFSYKDENMKKIVGVAVNNQGCIIACDLSGALHAISEDGYQRKTVLDRFDKIKAPHDVCFDKSGKVLLVCGDRFVEIYDVLF